MRLLGPDMGGGDGSAATQPNDAPATDETLVEETTEQTFEQKLRAALKLEDGATDDEVLAAIGSATAPADTSATDTQMADLQTQLTAAQERVTNFETAAQERAQSETDAMMAEYAHLPAETQGVLRETMLSDPTKGKALLAAMPKKAAPVATPPADPAATTDTPPAPTHDPKATEQKTSETELANKISARAKELVAQSNPKISLTKAYQQAETELKAKA